MKAKKKVNAEKRWNLVDIVALVVFVAGVGMLIMDVPPETIGRIFLAPLVLVPLALTCTLVYFALAAITGPLTLLCKLIDWFLPGESRLTRVGDWMRRKLPVWMERLISSFVLFSGVFGLFELWFVGLAVAFLVIAGLVSTDLEGMWWKIETMTGAGYIAGQIAIFLYVWLTVSVLPWVLGKIRRS